MLASAGEPSLSIIWGDQPRGDGIEMDARGLYLPAKDTGEATLGMAGLCEAEEPKGPGKANLGAAWLLEAEEVGIGGEKGSGGYCVTDACLLMVDAGEMDGGGGSSSPNDTPRARSFASLSSSTYLCQAERQLLASCPDQGPGELKG